jgi:transcription elongation factor SPT6
MTFTKGFGLESYQVVANFIASERLYFVQDQELNPTIYAEQFADPDPIKVQTPEELLRRARLILSTELGKDPLLRDHIRRLFREEAQITVEPTERGIVKIDQNHPYNVRLLKVMK